MTIGAEAGPFPDDGLDAARALLPGTGLESVHVLSAGERSTVQRVRATEPDGAERSLVVKRYHAGDEGWLRESAALSCLAHVVPAPRMIASAPDPQVVIMDDLGSGTSMADALLGTDPAVAEAAVLSWARAIAELHSATRGSRAAFADALAARGAPGGAARSQESAMASRLRDAERVLDRDCGALGVPIATGALDELTGLIGRLGPQGPAALTPADACPDNNVRVGDRLVLLDFEDAQWRHVAWDVAYLLVPWPTCWCSWQLPPEVAHRGVQAYRAAASAAFPEVDEDAFALDVEAAVAGWSLVSATWSLEYALVDERDQDAEGWGGDEASQRESWSIPSRRTRIMHRIARAATCSELPALAELSRGLHGALRERWGDLPLELAPAFRLPGQ